MLSGRAHSPREERGSTHQGGSDTKPAEGKKVPALANAQGWTVSTRTLVRWPLHDEVALYFSKTLGEEIW